MRARTTRTWQLDRYVFVCVYCDESEAVSTASSELNLARRREIVYARYFAFHPLSDMRSQVLETGVVLRLLVLLNHESNAVLSPVLRIIGNMVSGDDAQTEAVLR